MKVFVVAAIVCAPVALSSVARAAGPAPGVVELAVPEEPSATTAKILAAALREDSAHPRLAELTDGIGHRLSGSKSLDRAIDWAIASFTADGQEGVRRQKVMVPHWVRGEESARIVAPLDAKVFMLGLGGSPATPRGGITAEVISVPDFAALDALGPEKVRGKIVLFDHAMPPYGPDGPRYGETVVYRASGPARAAKLGAVAALVRSVTARSLRTPHTGSTHFEEGQKKIPAAAISTEDAALITRLTKRGPVRVRLVMSAKTLPDAPSANVIAELRGREKPDEIVLIGGHLDSWDVGQGAHDDGAGCIMVIEALRILRELGVRPRRTIRAVLFTNEENGLRGATEYAKQHANDRHFAAIETDTGGFEPKGFAARAHPDALKRLEALMTLLEPLGATKLEKADGPPGADISPLAPTGAPLLGLRMDISTYFDYHHSEADTLDKIDPRALQRSVAAMAVMAWALADEPQDLPRIEPTPASTAH
ncbi:M20/M25/M40 family metallo-hydrolase [Myxococcota bacterium]|nr:M20/M25/M40 family metallo-hydrolase [Myxococcota bacterium]